MSSFVISGRGNRVVDAGPRASARSARASTRNSGSSGTCGRGTCRASAGNTSACRCDNRAASSSARAHRGSACSAALTVRS